MNPLVKEYLRRKNSHSTPTARDANQLLFTAIHEAGHWLAYSLHGVIVLSAEVYRQPKRTGGGEVRAVDLCDFFNQYDCALVDCFVSLAGVAAECRVNPDKTQCKALAAVDLKQAQDCLDKILDRGTPQRVKVSTDISAEVHRMVLDNWSRIEALAFELMSTGNIQHDQPEKIEKRYGIGNQALSVIRQASAKKRLAKFHTSPSALVNACQL